jgi:hypothetical protein
VVGPLRLNPGTRRAVVGDKPLDLTALEFDLLACLARSRGRVKSREELVEAVAERNYDVYDRSVDVHVWSLRKKAGRRPEAAALHPHLSFRGLHADQSRFRVRPHAAPLSTLRQNSAVVLPEPGAAGRHVLDAFPRAIPHRPGLGLPSDASDRIDAVSDIILAEFNQKPLAKWSETLQRFDSGYHNKVRFPGLRRPRPTDGR